jgi:hypothetical protein
MTEKRILGCLRVPPVEYHCLRVAQRLPDCDVCTPWGITDDFQGYHTSSFLYIITALINLEQWTFLYHKPL